MWFFPWLANLVYEHCFTRFLSGIAMLKQKINQQKRLGRVFEFMIKTGELLSQRASYFFVSPWWKCTLFLQDYFYPSCSSVYLTFFCVRHFECSNWKTVAMRVRILGYVSGNLSKLRWQQREGLSVTDEKKSCVTVQDSGRKLPYSTFEESAVTLRKARCGAIGLNCR